MSMSRRKKSKQQTFWVPTAHLTSAGHPFYTKLNELLREDGFDEFVESECESYYKRGGRPSIAPGVYFRMLMIGFFERLDSERGICWRCADSLSLRSFLGLALDESTPEHSSLSRIRNRLPVEVHQAVFQRILELLAHHKLVRGKTVGVDATTLEANAAMRSIVRRDTGQSYEDFLTELAKASGVATPTREDLARIDRKRPKKGSNEDWFNPNDPDAQITRMKDGSTRMGHKLEHGVDLDSGTVLSVTIHGGAAGDTQTITDTVDQAKDRLETARQTIQEDLLHDVPAEELVADKGYCGTEVLGHLQGLGHRTYFSEPRRGRRRWKGDQRGQRAVYANRRRISGRRGKELLRRRGELLERPFEHSLNHGGMRRTYLRGHSKILKRLLIHYAGLNLALLMRSHFGAGTPKQLAEVLSGALAVLLLAIRRLMNALKAALTPIAAETWRRSTHRGLAMTLRRPIDPRRFSPAC